MGREQPDDAALDDADGAILDRAEDPVTLDQPLGEAREEAQAGVVPALLVGLLDMFRSGGDRMMEDLLHVIVAVAHVRQRRRRALTVRRLQELAEER